MSKIKKMFRRLFLEGYYLNDSNILKFLDRNPKASLLDLGCDDGSWTKKVAKKLETSNITGVDISKNRLEIAKNSGVKVVVSDLNTKLPFKAASFDVIHANQVIEHIKDLDTFVSEIYRVLKPGGYVVISTENGSSWHNIFAAIMGWQIFSLTNISTKVRGIGNPLAVHRGGDDYVHKDSWTHKTIFNYLGLKEFFEINDFHDVKISGAGYPPLPAVLGKLDPRHAHFITIKAHRKK